MKTDLLKDVIADADAIKKLAIENAKASLNETFDSKIKSMLAAKLQEEASEEDLEEEADEYDKMEEKKGEEDMMHKGDADEDDDADEAFDIDAILAEMERSDDEPADEPKKSKKSEDEPAEDQDEAYEEEDDQDEAYGKEKEMDEEINLDELLAELSAEEDEYQEEGLEEDDSAEDDTADMDMMKEEEGPEDEEAKMLKNFKKFLQTQRKSKAPKEEPKEEPKKESIELQEIKRQAAQLAKKVNETNLINAKLLYLNKVLRNHTLSEQQKIKVVAAFDKANSVKEAKIVYESLNEALNIKIQNTKVSLKESLGFASKASGTSTKRDIITEADAHVARWQKLANIKK
jgi:hypothetical protein